MKPPYVFKISTVLWIVIIMLIRITTSQSPCEYVAIHNKFSQRFLRTYNHTVAADSENKYYLYSVNLDRSFNFFLYDNHTDTFICVKKQKRKFKLIAKRSPTAELCLFKEEPIPYSSSYIRYVQPHLNYTMIFDKKGTQYLNRTRHGRAKKYPNMNDMRAFLVKKVHEPGDKCKRALRDFCVRMNHRKRLPYEIRTLCKKLK